MSKPRKEVQLIGFAKGSGKVVHVIVKSIDGPVTLCEAKPMQSEKEYSLESVTCKKCQRLKFYKDLFKSETSKENKPEPEKKEEEKPPEVSEEKPNTVPEDENSAPVIDEGSNQTLEEALKIKGQFVCELNMDGKYRIIHRVSQKPFFDGVNPKAIVLCLNMLNALETTWNGQGTPGSKYLSTIREVFKLAYIKCLLTYPKSLEEELKESKPKKPVSFTLRRRDKKKPKKTKIKRRDRTKIDKGPKKIKRRDNSSIFRKNSPKFDIIEEMKSPQKKSEIFRKVAEKHKLGAETLQLIFSTTVRQAVRNKGAIINITMNGSNAKGVDDIYHIKLKK